MNKEKNILKIVNYDRFKCVADKCKFTCCSGWGVSIDTKTYEKWKKEGDNCAYILDNIKINKYENETEYHINKDTMEDCPFLDNQRLCKIVNNNGEDYLSLTCHTFPRIENVFNDRKELSLSCACPEVVEIISNTRGKIHIDLENELNLKDDSLKLKIRKILIDVIQQAKFSIEDRLIIGYQMLLTALENEDFSEKLLLEELEKYENSVYIEENINMYKEIDLNLNESIEEINNLFLDIIENYKEVSILKIPLNDISEFAEDVKIKCLSDKWIDYKKLLNKYNDLIENCITAKILASCISDDIEEITISFQMIILEYLLMRHAVFLKYCKSKDSEIDIRDIKDYIVVFSRVIGNNIEAAMEFIKDGFDDYLLEIGYLCFIALF